MSTEKNPTADPMTPEANARAFYELTARILIRAFAVGAALLLLWLVVFLLLDKTWVAELHSKFMSTTVTAQQDMSLTWSTCPPIGQMPAMRLGLLLLA